MDRRRVRRSRVLRKIVSLLPLVFLPLLSQAQPIPIAPNAPITGYHLTFDDEFNTLSASNDPYLDHTLWCTCSWWFGPQGSANMVVESGLLHMKVTQNAQGNWIGSNLSSWSPSTHGFAQQFGYFEIRFKPSGQQGILGTFYLISEKNIVTNGAYPSGEIDIFEKPKGNILYLTLHDGTAAQQWRWNELGVADDFDQNFHTLGLLWQQNLGTLQWYLDGKFVFESAKYNDTDLSPMVMTLQATVNGAYQVPDDTTTNPSEMLVDYVRVFSNDPSVPLWTTAQ